MATPLVGGVYDDGGAKPIRNMFACPWRSRAALRLLQAGGAVASRGPAAGGDTAGELCGDA